VRTASIYRKSAAIWTRARAIAASEATDCAATNYPPRALPETLRIKGGAVDKVLGSLKGKGLIDHLGTPRGDDPPPLRITRAGLRAIGVETEGDVSEGASSALTCPPPSTARRMA
jgi:hypothetical protein